MSNQNIRNCGAGNSPPSENTLWLQRLLVNFKTDALPGNVNLDEWFSHLLDKPLGAQNQMVISPHIPGTAPIFNRIPELDSDLANLIIEEIIKAEERNNEFGSMESRGFNSEAADKLSLYPDGDSNHSNEAIINIRNRLMEFENEYHLKRLEQSGSPEGESESKEPDKLSLASTLSETSWIDILLRLNNHLKPNTSTSTSTGWLSDLLSKPPNIPDKIPKMDLSKTTALPTSKYDQMY